MSLEATRWASSLSPRSKGAARALLLILADKANPKSGHSCWHTVAYLAQIAGRSERSIQRQLGQLEAVGDIMIRIGHGRGKRNIITFPALSDVVKGDTFVTFYEPEKVTLLTPKGDTFGAEKVTLLTLKGDKSVTSIDQTESNLSTSKRQTSIDHCDDDDLAAPFRADVAGLAQRPLTNGERAVIDAAATDADGRARLGVALDRLRARWPEIVRRDDTSGWLASTLRNLAQDGTPARGAASAEALSERYARDDAPDLSPDNSFATDSAPYTIDGLLLEHAIDPEPVPPFVDLWQRTKDDLALQLASSAYYTWLHNTRAIADDDGVLVVDAGNQHRCEWLDNRLKSVCQRTLRSIAGNGAHDVRFVVGM